MIYLNESQIESMVEKAIDKLDKKFLNGEISQTEYDQEINIIDKWAIQQLKEKTA
jgi:hypothetical protein